MRLRIPFFVLATALLAGPGQAVTIFTAMLDGSQAVPPNSSSATGSATLVLSDDEQSLTYVVTTIGLDYASQSVDTLDDVIGAHIHNGLPGAPGPVVFGFISPSHDTDDFALNFVASTLTATMTGTWDAGDSGQSLADFVAALRAGELYINIHTNGFQGGEIRGQILVVPEPSTLALMSLGLIGLARAANARR